MYIMATAGHVDHGKTALIKNLTGTDTDQLAEEKSRGLSINIGFAYLHLADDVANQAALATTSIAFIDVPGHIAFIKNMLAGVSAIEHALLVIAADDGIMPQTLEHLAILDLLAIPTATVVLTKIDRVDQTRVASVKKEVQALFETSSIKLTRIFLVSNQTQAGIEPLKQHLAFLAKQEQQHRLGDFPRFSIDRAFSTKGKGTIITGTLISGHLQNQDQLMHSATAETVRIRSMRQDQQDLDAAIAGNRLALNINLNYKQIQRGDFLFNRLLHTPVTRFDARLQILTASAFRLNSGQLIHLYLGAAHSLAKVLVLDATANQESWTWVQIRTEKQLFPIQGDRFIIRDAANHQTVGGGYIVDIFPPRRHQRSRARLNYLKCLDPFSWGINQSDLKTRIGAIIDKSPAGQSIEYFAKLLNQAPTAINAMMAKNPALICLNHGSTTASSADNNTISRNLIFSTKKLNIVADDIHRCLKRYHQRHQDEIGITSDELFRLIQFKQAKSLYAMILHWLIQHGRLKQTKGLVHLPEHLAQTPKAVVQLLAKLTPILKSAGFVPPRTRELCDVLKIELKPLEQQLNRACQTGELIRVSHNRYFLTETLAEIATMIQALAADNDNEFSVIQFRDQSGIGRNLCIELLEFFDGIGFTQRFDNQRKVLQTALPFIDTINDN